MIKDNRTLSFEHEEEKLWEITEKDGIPIDIIMFFNEFANCHIINIASENLLYLFDHSEAETYFRDEGRLWVANLKWLANHSPKAYDAYMMYSEIFAEHKRNILYEQKLKRRKEKYGKA
jgi:hypothetical protein